MLVNSHPKTCGPERLVGCRQRGKKGIVTVDEKNNGLGFGVVFGGGDVTLEATNGLDAAGRLAFVDGATETARAHTDVFRHLGVDIYKSVGM